MLGGHLRDLLPFSYPTSNPDSDSNPNPHHPNPNPNPNLNLKHDHSPNRSPTPKTHEVLWRCCSTLHSTSAASLRPS